MHRTYASAAEGRRLSVSARDAGRREATCADRRSTDLVVEEGEPDDGHLPDAIPCVTAHGSEMNVQLCGADIGIRGRHAGGGDVSTNGHMPSTSTGVIVKDRIRRTKLVTPPATSIWSAMAAPPVPGHAWEKGGEGQGNEAQDGRERGGVEGAVGQVAEPCKGSESHVLRHTVGQRDAFAALVVSMGHWGQYGEVGRARLTD